MTLQRSTGKITIPTTIVPQGSSPTPTKKHCNRMVPEETRRDAKIAYKQTKVQTTRTGSHEIGCLSNASSLHQRVVHDGTYHVKTNTKLSTALVFLLIFLTTMVSSLPTASVDILHDIDESELSHSRVIFKVPTMVEFTQKDIEDSAKVSNLSMIQNLINRRQAETGSFIVMKIFK